MGRALERAMTERENWISVIAAARQLGITREAVYLAIGSGRLEAKQTPVVRRGWRIAPASLAGFKVSASHQKRGRVAASRSYRNGRIVIVCPPRPPWD